MKAGKGWNKQRNHCTRSGAMASLLILRAGLSAYHHFPDGVPCLYHIHTGSEGDTAVGGDS